MGALAPTCAPNPPRSPARNDATSTAVEFEESHSYDSDERLKATTTTIRNSAMAADSLTIRRSHTYDSKGRPETMETSPSKLKVGYEYNARGYLSRLKRGTSALATRTAVDARGNATGTAYGNGVSTTRAFDERGRVTAIGTAKGGAKVQEEAYGWRAVGSGSSMSPFAKRGEYKRNSPAETSAPETLRNGQNWGFLLRH